MLGWISSIARFDGARNEEIRRQYSVAPIQENKCANSVHAGSATCYVPLMIQ